MNVWNILLLRSSACLLIRPHAFDYRHGIRVQHCAESKRRAAIPQRCNSQRHCFVCVCVCFLPVVLGCGKSASQKTIGDRIRQSVVCVPLPAMRSDTAMMRAPSPFNQPYRLATWPSPRACITHSDAREIPVERESSRPSMPRFCE